MHNAALQEMGVDDAYRAIRVPETEFAEALAHLSQLGYEGVNCTVPLKSCAYSWCEPDEEAKRIKAVNTLNLKTREGINTDAPGFADTLQRLRVPRDRRALVLGAGGTARAVLPKLVEHGLIVDLYNRTYGKAAALVEELQIPVRVLKEISLEETALVLNLTSAELNGSTLEMDWNQAPEDCLAYDLMYRSELTEFLRRAKTAGRRVQDGRLMLVAQGARSLEWWLGRPVPFDVMEKAIQ
jgi:shikimate dehydrogenase